MMNEYIAKTTKDDPKDRIQVELGDSKQPDFKPQVKLMRWDNEVNASFRLIDSSFDGISPVTEGEKIKLIGAKKEIHFYDIAPNKEYPEGAYEFEIILKEKPASNILEFTIETKGLDFFYQPELTQQEIDEGHIRPENVVGSYAVYHKTKGGLNDATGKEYKVGKAFHIYRPKIIDADGKWVWGELHIDVGNELQTITIPQDFLDTAVYPIRHATGEVFGYNTGGGTDAYINWEQTTDTSYYVYRTGEAITASEDGTISDIQAYVRSTNAGTTSQTTTLAVNEKDSVAGDSHGLIGSGEASLSYVQWNVTPTWQQITGLSISITNGNTYILNIITDPDNNAQNKRAEMLYDSATSVAYYAESFGPETTAAAVYSNAKEDPWTDSSSGTSVRYSIYANYTPSANGGPAGVKTVNGLAIASVKTVNDLATASVKTINDAS